MNLPNKITCLRIVLVPVFMAFALMGTGATKFIALLVFVIASLTDSLDGYIARKYHLVTDFGKFVDPLADKLLVTAALLVFLQLQMMPAWAVMIILARDLIVSSLRMVAAAEGRVIQAVFSGKLKTTVHVVGIIIMLMGLGSLEGAITVTKVFDCIRAPLAMVTHTTMLQSVITWIMVLLSAYSCVDYVYKNFDIIKDGLVKGGKKK